jgi:hypothetical protein
MPVGADKRTFAKRLISCSGWPDFNGRERRHRRVGQHRIGGLVGPCRIVDISQRWKLTGVVKMAKRKLVRFRVLHEQAVSPMADQ